MKLFIKVFLLAIFLGFLTSSLFAVGDTPGIADRIKDKRNQIQQLDIKIANFLKQRRLTTSPAMEKIINEEIKLERAKRTTLAKEINKLKKSPLNSHLASGKGLNKKPEFIKERFKEVNKEYSILKTEVYKLLQEKKEPTTSAAQKKIINTQIRELNKKIEKTAKERKILKQYRAVSLPKGSEFDKNK